MVQEAMMLLAVNNHCIKWFDFIVLKKDRNILLTLKNALNDIVLSD